MMKIIPWAIGRDMTTPHKERATPTPTLLKPLKQEEKWKLQVDTCDLGYQENGENTVSSYC
jgi:hypothetical protein